MQQRSRIVLGALLVLALVALLIAAISGSVALSAGDLWYGIRQIWHGQPDIAGALLQLRLERAGSAFVTGAMLALAGVLMQALLRNPLADPYVLGVSGGAAVGALLAMLLAGAAWMIDAAAFGGALLVALLLFALAHRDLRGAQGGSEPSLLLLTGVIVASGCGALVTLMLSLAPDGRLRGMVFWLIGDLSGAQWRWLPWLILSGALLVACRAARAINVLAMHAQSAATLGIRVAALQRGLFALAALLTASAVAGAGSIGFVGLIVPHACRFALGPDHRLLLPAATLSGGIFLMLADTAARTLVAPQQLPVGVITVLIGAPLFLLQLHYLRRA
ncbi:MAG: ABC-type transport system, permease component [Herbaspirillum sp.]|nr:ABC-type transport system, permease component [Herbaspirillum sp.]